MRYQIYNAATPRFPRSCETMREVIGANCTRVANLPTARSHLIPPLSLLQIVSLWRTALRPPTRQWRRLSSDLPHLRTSEPSNKQEAPLCSQIRRDMHVSSLDQFEGTRSWQFVQHSHWHQSGFNKYSCIRIDNYAVHHSIYHLCIISFHFQSHLACVLIS